MTTENLIIINGGSYTNIKKALQQWIELYSSDLDKDLIFHLYKDGKNNYVIKADERLDNERFFYLINYLKYPEGIDYSIEITGYTTAKNQKEISNQNLLVFIPEDDIDYDYVFVVTQENKTFKIDFGGKISVVNESRNYKLPKVNSQ